MLTEIRYIQNIGRFEKAIPTANAGFGHCTLVFGENGWGKSTLADILRSLATDNPAIVVGRKTLAGGLLYQLDTATRFRLWYAKGLTPYDPSAVSGPMRSRLGLLTGEVQVVFQ